MWYEGQEQEDNEEGCAEEDYQICEGLNCTCLFVFHLAFSRVVVKNDRKGKRTASMLRILHLELDYTSAMTGIHSV